MQKQLTHGLFLDDSGTKEYTEGGQTYSDRGGKSRYFVFGGLLAEVAAGKALAAEIARLKKQTFGTEDVEIKANWLNFAAKRASKYLEKYNITNEKLLLFEGDFH